MNNILDALMNPNVVSAMKFNNVEGLLKAYKSKKIAKELRGDKGPILYLKVSVEGRVYRVIRLSDHSHVLDVDEAEANEVLKHLE